MARLLVVVPGIGGHTSQFSLLLDLLKASPSWAADTQILLYDHNRGIFSRKLAAQIANDLAILIEGEWLEKGSFEDIVLIGHSMGALLVRQAYLTGLGSSLNRMRPKPWASKVSRMVLLAGINRGLKLSIWEKLLAALLLPGPCLLRDLLHGSDFVTNLRLWWIKKLAAQQERPLVVQVLGDHDNEVNKQDSLDIEGFLEGHQLMVQGANHESVLHPGKSRSFSDQHAGILRLAVMGSIPDSLADNVVCDASRKVYFVAHGIRDTSDDWVKDVSSRIELAIPGARAVTTDVGRFSALQFVLPMLRRKKIRFFQDLYSQELAQNPLATFNFVGHSYGTYLVGYSISRLSGVQFDRVFLGGSVLPAQWSWARYTGQVNELRNSRAQRDIPVGILCSALRGLRMLDIGTAGFTGFRIPFGQNSEVRFYKGGHGATVANQNRPDILGFLTQGLVYSPNPQNLLPQDGNLIRFSAGAPLLTFLLVLSYALALLATIIVPAWHHSACFLLVDGAIFLVIFFVITAFI
jgi:pimeloyl-ACP methyl ester carboxylesterase